MNELNTGEHIYHHNDTTPRISLKAEKNTKGWNYEASVSNCPDVDTAMAILELATQRLAFTYGTKEETK